MDLSELFDVEAEESLEEEEEEDDFEDEMQGALLTGRRAPYHLAHIIRFHCRRGQVPTRPASKHSRVAIPVIFDCPSAATRDLP